MALEGRDSMQIERVYTGDRDGEIHRWMEREGKKERGSIRQQIETEYRYAQRQWGGVERLL